MSAPYENAALQRFLGGAMHIGGNELTLMLSRALCPGCTVLDVGCGMGASVKLLRESGFDAHGVDASRSLVNAAMSRHVSLGSAYELPRRGYDALLYECSFSLLENKPLALSNAHAALRRGGLLLISDMYARSGAPDAKKAPHAPDEATLKTLFHAHGFELISFCDHTDALKRFIAALIMEFGSADAFLCAAAGGCAALPPGCKLGYYCAIWRKRDD